MTEGYQEAQGISREVRVRPSCTDQKTTLMRVGFGETASPALLLSIPSQLRPLRLDAVFLKLYYQSTTKRWILHGMTHISLQVLVHSRFSRVWLCTTPWTIACQAPLSTGFSRQEDWRGLSYPSPEYLLDPGIERASLTSPALGPNPKSHSTLDVQSLGHADHRKASRQCPNLQLGNTRLLMSPCSKDTSSSHMW